MRLSTFFFKLMTYGNRRAPLDQRPKPAKNQRAPKHHNQTPATHCLRCPARAVVPSEPHGFVLEGFSAGFVPVNVEGQNFPAVFRVAGCVGVIMVPSFIAIILEKPAISIGLLAPFHAVAGTATAILGVWIVGGWRLRQSTKFCAPKRKFMRATFILWLVTLSLGVIFYFVLNWSFLFG